VSQGFLSKRNLAIIFGAALVLTVVITAVAIGIGHPNVPSDDVAVVDDASINVPGVVEDGVISKTNFDRFLDQTAKQNNLQSVPQAGTPQYNQLKDQAMGSILQIAWITGEANKQGLTFTDTQIQQSLQQIKSQFKNQADYEKARDQAGLTEADVLVRAKLQLIQNKIEENISNGVPTPSTDDARTFYDANKDQFTQPASRTIRLIQNKDAAKVNQAIAALKADDSDANWKKVAAQYSTDPTSKDKGGLRSDVIPGSFEQPVDDDIFKAPTGQVQGPVTTSTNTYAFEVVSVTPEKVQGFDDPVSSSTGQPGGGTVGEQIKQQLRSQQQQEALSVFGEDFQSYWTGLTQCASGYVTKSCDNYNGSNGIVPSPSCDPAKLAPSSQTGGGGEGCPAPVFSTCQEGSASTGGQPGQLQCAGPGPSPAAPGTIKPFVTSSGSAPQGPHPAGEATTPPTSSLPSGLSGLGGQ